MTAAPRPRHFLEVTLLAGLVLLVETVLFHVLHYIHDFFAATAVISYAVLGIGLGAFAATWVRRRPVHVFYAATLASTLSLYLTSVLLLWQPHLVLVAASISLCVFFPVVYITVMFRDHPGGRVYLYDMAGAGLGVVAVVVLYEVLVTEAIVALLLTALPLLGAVRLLADRETGLRPRLVGAGLALALVAVGSALFVGQVRHDALNIYTHFNRSADVTLPGKVLAWRDPSHLVRSYDSLVGRLDILKDPEGTAYAVSYNGWVNDHFRPGVKETYAQTRRVGDRYPTPDARVLYGLVDEPRMYIIGSAAYGIIHTAKMITPPERIFPVEIHPAIPQLMQEDFFEESGRAYEGLEPITGNALSIIKELDQTFDIVTLINAHSGHNIGTWSGPDYLHTYESYDLYFNKLSDDGYILFEERPYNRHGELGLYRMLNTLYRVLADRGVENPSRHFVIWEWMNQDKRIPKLLRPSGNYKHAGGWYYSMIVTKSPLEGAALQRTLYWYHKVTSPMIRLAYLQGYSEVGEVGEVMGMIERADFTPLEEEGFVAAPVTNDRPFPSLSMTRVPALEGMLAASSVVFLLLTALLYGVGRRGVPTRRMGLLSSYNLLIGFGYFFIEIILLETYVNVFVSPAWSLVLVLGLLLVSSGIGGLVSHRVSPWAATAALSLVALAATFAPTVLVYGDVPLWVAKAAGVLLIGGTGVLMGVFFPRGLVLADRWSLKHRVPHLFAINSVAGSFAVVVALYLGFRVGYLSTLSLAVVVYCAAGLMITRAEGWADEG